MKNANGHIREYIPKGTDFNESGDLQIKEVEC